MGQIKPRRFSIDPFRENADGAFVLYEVHRKLLISVRRSLLRKSEKLEKRIAELENQLKQTK